MLIKDQEHLKIRSLTNSDFPLMAKWLSDPRVLEFYEGRDNPFNEEKVKQVFGDDQKDNVVKCIFEWKEQPIGYIQFYQLNENSMLLYGYKNEVIYGTDQFIGEVDFWNNGIGTMLVKAITSYLINIKKANAVVLDPRAENLRAIRCYENCGFTKVKVLPKRELHEGKYHDCWLLEFRAEDSK